MKQKLISTLVAATLGLGLASVAQADIVASSGNFAREVVKALPADSAVNLPQIGYGYGSGVVLGVAGNTNGTTNWQTQFILDQTVVNWHKDSSGNALRAVATTVPATCTVGTLNKAKDSRLDACDIFISGTDPTTGLTVSSSIGDITAASATSGGGAGNYFTLVSGPSVSGNILYMNLATKGGKSLKDVTIRVNNAGAIGLASLSGYTELDKNICTEQAFVTASYKHIIGTYSSLSSDLPVYSDSGKKYFQVSDAIQPIVTPLQQASLSVDIATTAFKPAGTLKNAGAGSNLVNYQGGTAVATPLAQYSIVNLGTVYVKQVAGSVDADGTSAYSLSMPTSTTDSTPKASTIGFPGKFDATGSVNGAVEVKSIDVDVTGAFQNGSTLQLCTGPSINGAAGTNCGAAKTISGTASQTVKLQTSTYLPAWATGTKDGVVKGDAEAYYIVYTTNTANGSIPNTTIEAQAKIIHTATGTTGTGEADSADVSCKKTLTSIGGSAQIDVRNYLPSSLAGGSLLRLINPSETKSTEVYGQWIHSDGTFGKTGKIASIPARGVTNMNAKTIEGLLITAPDSAADATAANQLPNASATNGSGGRLRLTSSNGELRVQNYYFDSQGGWIELSGAQGVDAPGNDVGTNLNTFYGTANGEDAQKGLNGK